MARVDLGHLLGSDGREWLADHCCPWYLWKDDEIGSVGLSIVLPSTGDLTEEKSFVRDVGAKFVRYGCWPDEIPVLLQATFDSLYFMAVAELLAEAAFWVEVAAKGCDEPC